MHSCRRPLFLPLNPPSRSKILQPRLLGAASQASRLANNPVWVAPEVVGGGRPSAASDVYGFGLVLLELLTWSLPWGEDAQPYQARGAMLAYVRVQG